MTALTAEQLTEIEAAARYGIDAAYRGWRTCGPLQCMADPADPSAALVGIPPAEHAELHSAKWGLWARWFSHEEVRVNSGRTLLRVRPRDDKPTEPEGWQEGDIVADAEGSIWTRVNDPDWPWNHGADHMRGGNQSGSAEEARLLRPLLLLVRDGKPVAYNNISNALGEQ